MRNVGLCSEVVRVHLNFKPAEGRGLHEMIFRRPRARPRSRNRSVQLQLQNFMISDKFAFLEQNLGVK